MRTIYGNLKVDVTTAPNPTFMLEHDGNAFPIGMTLEHYGERNTNEAVYVFGRSGRTFFRERKTPEEIPSKEYIVPSCLLISSTAKGWNLFRTDNAEFAVLDLLATEQPCIAVRIPDLDPDGIYIIDLKHDRTLHFRSIDEYDIHVSNLAERDIDALPIPNWCQDHYDFSGSAFVQPSLNSQFFYECAENPLTGPDAGNIDPQFP